MIAMTCLALLLGAAAISPDTTDPRVIMDAVDARPDGDRMASQMEMTITDAAGHERVRQVRVKSIDFDAGRKSLILFESPADVRNTGLLSVDYDDGNRDDDQWLYLPSLHKSTRISSGDKSGAFMGSDLSYADLTRSDPDHYDYKLLESTEVDGRPCWRIEARPRTEKSKTETGYLKTQLWVDKERLLPLQIKAWVLKGKKLKYIKFDEIRNVDNIWTAHRVSARTVRGGKVESTTLMRYSNLRYNQDVKAADFTHQRLEKGV